MRSKLHRLSLAERVQRVFAEPREQPPEFTFGHLLQEVQPASPDELALALAQLTTTRFLEKIIRVESPESHGGIGDFHSLAEIPHEMRDWRTNRVIEVRPENLTIIFRPGPEARWHAR
jgi:hypothetical protein